VGAWKAIQFQPPIFNKTIHAEIKTDLEKIKKDIDKQKTL